MQHLGKWVAGTLGGVLAIAVLFYAANAKSAGTYNSALLIFVVLLVFVFAQIKRGFDQEDRKRKSDEAPDDPDKAAAASTATGPKAAGGAGAGKSGAAKTAGSTSGGAQAGASKATSSKSSGSKAAAAKSGAAQSGAAQSGAAQSGGTTQARSPAGPTNGSSAKH
jgi:hypothetical protein